MKSEAIRQAGSRKGLRYGPLPEDELKQLSNAKREDLQRALTERMRYREDLNLEPEWRAIRPGITPEKRKKRQEQMVAKAKKVAAGGAAKTKGTLTRNQGYACRLACLTVLDQFYDEYLRSKGGGDGVARGEQDSREVNANHRFYFLVARAMATVGWRDSHGNPLSVPDDHSNDDRAPERLKSLLENLDLEGAAVSLREELEVVYRGDEGAFYAYLQESCYKWLKDIKKHHTVRGVPFVTGFAVMTTHDFSRVASGSGCEGRLLLGGRVDATCLQWWLDVMVVVYSQKKLVSPSA